MNSSPPFMYCLQHVSKRLEKAGAVFTLRIPDLTIRRGELVAFVGESGCGKSTLLDMLGLISAATSAAQFDVCFREGDPDSIGSASESRLAELRRRHLGYVLQSGGLLPFLSVGENILLSRRVNGNTDGPEVRNLARSLGIEGQWRKKPAFLSGGQRQRVAIARALAHSPSVVLADEPTGAVDKMTARDIRDLLREVARTRNTTVIIVTHDEALVSGITDRVFSFNVERLGPDSVESTLLETAWTARGQTGGEV
ncbi:MAG: ATP-binding cassette domain-containing protein [Verrucomicrobiota bacterium]